LQERRRHELAHWALSGMAVIVGSGSRFAPLMR
jgi:hypothetical protein